LAPRLGGRPAGDAGRVEQARHQDDPGIGHDLLAVHPTWPGLSVTTISTSGSTKESKISRRKA
jgi:hypothetical protein